MAPFTFTNHRCPSCHSTNSFKALNETQSAQHSQKKSSTGFNLFSLTTNRLREGTVLHLHRLSDSTIFQISQTD